MQLNIENSKAEIITDYESRKIITLGEQTPMCGSLTNLMRITKAKQHERLSILR